MLELKRSLITNAVSTSQKHMEWFPLTFDLQKGQRAVWESTDRSEYICKHHRDGPEINPTQPKQTIHLDVNETL